MQTLKSLFTVLTITAALTAHVYAQSFLTNGLVAYYPFNGNATDASTNANSGTVYGATLTTNRFGSTNQAYHFNGSSAYISAPNQPYLTFPAGQFTISLWAAVNGSTPNPMFLLGLDNGPGEQYKWFVSFGWQPDQLPNPAPNGYLSFSINDGGHAYYLPAVKWGPTLGSWHHYIFIKQSTTYALYIDGVSVPGTNYMVNSSTGYSLSSGVVGPQAIPSGITAPLTIGTAEGGAFFNGNLDDLRIYNVAFTASQVQQLYSYESQPSVTLKKAVKPSFSNLSLNTNYQLQVSTNLVNWVNQGSPFTPTNSAMDYSQYFDVTNWTDLFFQLQPSQ